MRLQATVDARVDHGLHVSDPEDVWFCCQSAVADSAYTVEVRSQEKFPWWGWRRVAAKDFHTQPYMYTTIVRMRMWFP